MMRRRMPAQLVETLRRAAEKTARGPSDPIRTGQSDEHVAGMEEERERQARWRSSWITPDLAAIVAWAEGEITIQDITYQTSAYRRVVEQAFAGGKGDR